MRGRVLVIAGSDCSGGAGIQADIKTVTALGGYAMTAITALTAQNTTGVYGVIDTPPEFVSQQIDLCLSDIGADCIKTGMLHNANLITAIAESLQAYPKIPLILDPVMFAKGNAPLLQKEAVASLKKYLLPRAAILTPNIPEAEELSGRKIQTLQDMRDTANSLLQMGAAAILLKGGHLISENVTDILATADGIESFSNPRIDTRHTHGTGCTLASAIATGLAQDMSMRDAVLRARRYVIEAIRAAPQFGKGHGPLNHSHSLPPKAA